MSVMLTWVLLNVARILAMPLLMFFAPLALTIFLPAMSSASNSAAVGAATEAAGTPSGGLGASGAGAPPSTAGGPAFLGALAGGESLPGLAAGLPATASSLASF